jgi:hypothetical protein
MTTESFMVLCHIHLNGGLTENCTRPVFVIRLISGRYCGQDLFNMNVALSELSPFEFVTERVK